MARYFFELSEGGTSIPDKLGTVCKDDQTAVAYGWKVLAQCISEPAQILPWQHAEMAVIREDGVMVARIGMTTSVETPNPATAEAVARLHVADGLPSPAALWDSTRPPPKTC